jgi:hypothetical protein
VGPALGCIAVGLALGCIAVGPALGCIAVGPALGCIAVGPALGCIAVGAGLAVSVEVGAIETIGLADGVGDVFTLLLLVNEPVPPQAKRSAASKIIVIDVGIRISVSVM